MRAIFCLLLSLPALVNAQLSMPASTKADWNRLIQLAKQDNPAEKELSGLPVYEIKGNLYVSLFGKTVENPQWGAFENFDVIRGSQILDISTIKVPLEYFDEIDFNQVFSYIELPARVFPDLHRVIIDVHADSVQHGINLPEAYTGKDVLIGVTDWGFDYTHPMFYDTLLQETRIVAAWDQYKQLGDQPQNYPYGAQYNTVQELLEAQSDTANIYSYHTHGNHVAGIAGGSGAGSDYRGMAPEAGFLFVTFLVDAASVLDAFSWMKQMAEEQDKRLVINMSWGLYYIGTLDGNSLLSQAIDALSDEGVVFVSSGGNNGDNNFHIEKTFNNDTLTTRIAFDSYANPTMWGESITMWGEVSQSFKIRMKAYSGSNVLLSETPTYHTESADAYLDSMLVFNEDTVWFNLTAEASHPLNGRPFMRLRVKNTNPNYKIVLEATAESGTVHFWNLVELTSGVGNWGLSFISFGENGMGGDPNNSIGEPACTASVIAVAAYSASYQNNGGNWVGGQLASFSSRGPLITGAMKPDIAAPGVNVTSSISSYTDASYTSTETITFNGNEYDFAKFSGTSMSSPCVAGIVALLLDANPNLTPSEIKQILQATARVDDETGPINPPGDTRWGYGKVDAYAAIQMALEYLFVNEGSVLESTLIYPDPFQDYINIRLKNDDIYNQIELFSSEGKLMNSSLKPGLNQLPQLQSGVYFVRLSNGEKVEVIRMVKI
jgi:minor extracellular serine protease Vpr